MRGMRLVLGVMGASLTLGSATACGRASEYEAAGDIAPAGRIGVHVQNDNFLDVDVYAVSEGVATRLGSVTGNGSRTFVIDPSLAAQDLRIVATPIGGNGRASTGSIVVGPGQTVDFRVGSTLRNSSVVIR